MTREQSITLRSRIALIVVFGLIAWGIVANIAEAIQDTAFLLWL